MRCGTFCKNDQKAEMPQTLKSYGCRCEAPRALAAIVVVAAEFCSCCYCCCCSAVRQILCARCCWHFLCCLSNRPCVCSTIVCRRSVCPKRTDLLSVQRHLTDHRTLQIACRLLLATPTILGVFNRQQQQNKNTNNWHEQNGWRLVVVVFLLFVLVVQRQLLAHNLNPSSVTATAF